MGRMCVNTSLKIKIKTAFFAMCIWIFFLQSPLESIWSSFSYIDEIVALLGIFLMFYYLKINGKMKLSSYSLFVVVLIMVFLITGVLANLIYKYQPAKIVLMDMFTCTKFFLAIVFGFYAFNNNTWEDLRICAVRHARTLSLFVFVVFLLDQLLDIYPNEFRYGFKCAKLFFYHSTYLAGAVAFLIILLTVFYNKSNRLYILFNLIVLFFTFRSKAMASVAVYLLLFFCVIVYKKRIKKRYLIFGGIFCIFIGWEQISYYFVELAGRSARSVMTFTSLKILKSYFPIGTGFATYGSALAGEFYSPVYVMNGFENVHGLGTGSNALFLSDTFWPIVIGQTGFIGTIAYITALLLIIKMCVEVRRSDVYAYLGIMYAVLYLLISSIAEPSFFNSISIPMAVVIGMVFKRYRNRIN